MELRSARLHCSDEPSAAIHGEHATRATPWPRFVPGRVRFLPRIDSVVLVINHGRRALTSHAGDLSTAVDGGTTAFTPNSNGPIPLLPPRANRSRSSLILWLRITHTPSMVILLKKPPVICY
jgi:hypothetical protein